MNLEIARKHARSDDPRVRLPALKALGEKGGLADLQIILAYVNDADPAVKEIAVTCSCGIIHENLISRYHELEEQVRVKLGTLLNTLSPTVVDQLSKDLYSDDEARRVRTVQILGLLKKNPRVRDVIADLVQDRNVKVRATAVNLLGRIISFDDRDKSLIVSLLNDNDKRVRANTIEALEALGNKRVVPMLLRFRNDPANRIRGNVLKALHSLGYGEIEEDLHKMISSNDNYMKASGFWVISQVKLHSPRLEDSAGYYLLSENEMVVNNARNALSALDTPRAKGYLRYLDSAAKSSVG